MKKLGEKTSLLVQILSQARFTKKRFVEESDGEISFSENSYEDLSRYSKILRNKGFSEYKKIESFYKDERAHTISNGSHTITFKTDSSLGRSFITLKLWG